MPTLGRTQTAVRGVGGAHQGVISGAEHVHLGLSMCSFRSGMGLRPNATWKTGYTENQRLFPRVPQSRGHGADCAPQAGGTAGGAEGRTLRSGKSGADPSAGRTPGSLGPALRVPLAAGRHKAAHGQEAVRREPASFRIRLRCGRGVGMTRLGTEKAIQMQRARTGHADNVPGQMRNSRGREIRRKN